MTATLPPLTEKQFQRQVTELAELLGWEWVHFRPAQTEKGWRTPVSGTLGKGWVDLILVRERDRRILFVELKAEGGKLTPEQEQVVGLLRQLAGLDQFGRQWIVDWQGETTTEDTSRSLECHVWRPSDWPEIEAGLR